MKKQTDERVLRTTKNRISGAKPNTDRGRTYMQAIRILLFAFLPIFADPAFSQVLSRNEAIALTRDLRFPKAWHMSKNMKLVSKDYPDSYCTVFHSTKTKKWLGELCISSNKDFIWTMGFAETVPDEERWGDRDEQQIGYYTFTPLFTYPMTPLMADPIQIYAAESDCYLDDGPVYRATSMCHTALYELRPGVFIFTAFDFFDNVKRKQKAQLSDIKDLWIQVGNRIKKESRY
ncbi:hypothetical protein [Herbaspirillum sp. CAH-3]|uniref:hypothetical protein n=1 Tax=Herbaspirillum sp. CAH-3 TaxID=2605746 RepID=UPI001E4064C7|nr:hypothetical protein [Herbaspirillum sp. CAH-3]